MRVRGCPLPDHHPGRKNERTKVRLPACHRSFGVDGDMLHPAPLYTRE